MMTVLEKVNQENFLLEVSPTLLNSYLFCPKNAQIILSLREKSSTKSYEKSSLAVMGSYIHAAFYFSILEEEGDIIEALSNKNGKFYKDMIDLGVIEEKNYLSPDFEQVIYKSFEFFNLIKPKLNISEVLFIEKKFEATFERIKFLGVVDFGFKSKNSNFYVVDIKTNINGYMKTKEMQMAIYSFLVQKNFNLDSLPEVLLIHPIQRKIYKISRKLLELNLRLAIETAKRLMISYMRSEFPENNSNCYFCKLKRLCKK